ncbi:phosphotriesterase [Cryobacterium sp. N19]|uniref:phosphotriesterase family protein n=1 Tax=Cryobacterium sp. N19 TaxID=2048288 RepID=UPI000CE4D327|nr:aryldialkylphosphatase [Cryobacterium sp. N19]
MPYVQTVLGPVPADTLGRVMPHEHIFSLVPGPWLTGGRRDTQVDLAVDALSALQEAGFSTVVDLSPYGVVGRDADGANVEALQEVATRTGLNIVAGTAVYLESYSPQWTLDASLAELTARFVRDATVGIGNTGIRAGVLGEQATGLGVITAHEEKGLRAAGRASSETGLSIFTHTTHGTMALEQIGILRNETVDLSRVVIGHMDTHADPSYVRMVLDHEVTVAIDTIGKEVWDFFLGPAASDRQEGEFTKRAYHRSDEKRADLVAELVAEGHVERITLALDLTGAEVWLNPSTHGQQGYTYLSAVFLPMLRERGVTETQCEQLVAGNPSRLLAIGASK